MVIRSSASKRSASKAKPSTKAKKSETKPSTAADSQSRNSAEFDELLEEENYKSDVAIAAPTSLILESLPPVASKSDICKAFELREAISEMDMAIALAALGVSLRVNGAHQFAPGYEVYVNN